MSQLEPKQYKVGDSLVTTGEQVCHIVGQTDRTGVFLIEGDRIRWEFYADSIIPEHAHRANSKYETLWYEVKAGTAAKSRRPLILQIANSLFSALDTQTASAVDEYFAAVEESVHYQTRANQSFRYLLGALTALVFALIIEIILVAFIGFNTDTTPILLAAGAGGMGAVVSVLQRISSLDLGRFTPLWYAFLQGAARASLGMLFGLFFVLANKANLVLGTFAGNLYAIAAFGALSGISERFVPEIIRKMEGGETSPVAPRGSA